MGLPARHTLLHQRHKTLVVRPFEQMDHLMHNYVLKRACFGENDMGEGIIKKKATVVNENRVLIRFRHLIHFLAFV